MPAYPETPDGAGGGGQGEEEGDFLFCEAQKVADAQKKIDGMGQEEAEEISVHSQLWQKKEQQHHIQRIGENIESDGLRLLAQPLGDGIGDGIAVEHRHQRRILPQKRPRLFKIGRAS